MLPDPSQLATLLAIVEEGSFDAAARRLHLTPSAVSQRIRALESTAGLVLVRRTTPAEVTAEGEAFLRLARRLELVEAEFDAFHGDPTLRVAVNADTLAIWFGEVVSAVAAAGDVALQVFVEDQGHSQELLRRGEVVAAISSDPQPVQGCSVEPLGTLRYLPVAHPDLLERHRRGRGIDWASLPLVVFNEKDLLQDQVLARHGVDRPAIVHRMPSSVEFADAVGRGLGWGVLPEAQLDPALVRLPRERSVDVALFWHRWRLDLPALDAMTGWVRAAAATRLRR